MKHAIGLLIIIALVIGLAIIMTSNPGYVVMVKPPYRYEFSLSFLLLFILMIFLCLHLCLQFIHYIRKLPANARAYKESQRLKEGNAALLEGMHALAVNNIEVAKKSAERAQKLIKNEDLELLIKIISEPQQQKLDL